MTQQEPETIKIKVDTGKGKKLRALVKQDTGELLEVTGEDPDGFGPVDQEFFNKKCKDGGFTYIGSILHSHDSPGCIYVVFGGVPYRICW